MPFRVRYFCHWGKLTGYGRAARDYVAALACAGVELDIVPYEGLSSGEGFAPSPRATSPEPRYAWLDHLVRTASELGPADVEIHHTLPRVLAAVNSEEWPAARGAWGAARKRVALTTWETDTFPDEYVKALRDFNAVIVPSKFCRDAIGNMHRATHIVPHCFDPAFWDLGAARHGMLDDIGKCHFYTIGAWSERKNPLGVLRAYLHAFTSDDDVRLTMVMSNPDLDAIRSTIARSGMPSSALPEIHVPDRSLSEQELVELHARADCFVSATRSEGWGLGHFEAAIMGRWVLSPTWGGHADFLRRGFDDDPEYPRLLGVRHSRTPCFGAEVKGAVIERDGKRMQQSTIAMPPGVTCKHTWAEPDLATMAQRMRDLYEERRSGELDDYAEEMPAARASLEERYGYNAVGHQMAGLLQEIAR
jgi:glycosyltransferase involved in cell wall biosynthesis